MPKTSHIVRRILLSDETFRPLRGKLDESDYKRIYNRAYSRLRKQGTNKSAVKGLILDEIRSELFKLLPKVETETVTDSQREENEFMEKPVKEYAPIHGVRLWGDEPTKDDRIEDLKESYNQSVKNAFGQSFCPICKSNPCVCQDHEYY